MATTTLSNDNTIQFTAAQTSREVKKHLKKVFPHMEKLSVTCKNFSLRISWINGPSRNAVEQATKVFEGATLEQNGGDTIKGYKPPVEFQGKQIDFGIDYIFCERTLSPENEAIITKYVQDKYGEDTSVNHHISEKRIWDLIKETDANDFSSLVWAPIETTVEEPITEEIATVASTLSLPVDEVAKVYAIAQEYKQLQDADRATFAAETKLETVASYAQAQEKLQHTSRISNTTFQSFLDLAGARKFIETAMNHYQEQKNTPGWFTDWLDDLYIRLSEDWAKITLDEMVSLANLHRDNDWMPQSLAVNQIYKMFDRLGRDTSGIIGY